MDLLCFFLSCVCCAFVRALWSPAGKGLTSWLCGLCTLTYFVPNIPYHSKLANIPIINFPKYSISLKVTKILNTVSHIHGSSLKWTVSYIPGSKMANILYPSNPYTSLTSKFQPVTLLHVYGFIFDCNCTMVGAGPFIGVLCLSGLAHPQALSVLRR